MHTVSNIAKDIGLFKLSFNLILCQAVIHRIVTIIRKDREIIHFSMHLIQKISLKKGKIII